MDCQWMPTTEQVAAGTSLSNRSMLEGCATGQGNLLADYFHSLINSELNGDAVIREKLSKRSAESIADAENRTRLAPAKLNVERLQRSLVVSGRAVPPPSRRECAYEVLVRVLKKTASLSLDGRQVVAVHRVDGDKLQVTFSTAGIRSDRHRLLKMRHNLRSRGVNIEDMVLHKEVRAVGKVSDMKQGACRPQTVVVGSPYGELPVGTGIISMFPHGSAGRRIGGVGRPANVEGMVNCRSLARQRTIRSFPQADGRGGRGGCNGVPSVGHGCGRIAQPTRLRVVANRNSTYAPPPVVTPQCVVPPRMAPASIRYQRQSRIDTPKYVVRAPSTSQRLFVDSVMTPHASIVNGTAAFTDRHTCGTYQPVATSHQCPNPAPPTAFTDRHTCGTYQPVATSHQCPNPAPPTAFTDRHTCGTCQPVATSHQCPNPAPPTAQSPKCMRRITSGMCSVNALDEDIRHLAKSVGKSSWPSDSEDHGDVDIGRDDHSVIDLGSDDHSVIDVGSDDHSVIDIGSDDHSVIDIGSDDHSVIDVVSGENIDLGSDAIAFAHSLEPKINQVCSKRILPSCQRTLDLICQPSTIDGSLAASTSETASGSTYSRCAPPDAAASSAVDAHVDAKSRRAVLPSYAEACLSLKVARGPPALIPLRCTGNLLGLNG